MDIIRDYPGKVAAVIRSAMEAKGISVNDLSRRSGIARMTLTRRLAGSPLSMDELARIAPHLGMTPGQLSTEAEQAAA